MKLLKDFSKKELADLQKGQKIMTNMLKEFDNICRTNGLNIGVLAEHLLEQLDTRVGYPTTRILMLQC